MKNKYVMYSAVVLLPLLFLGGCGDLTGPEGKRGRDAEGELFSFAVADAPLESFGDLSAFSTALKARLEQEPGGDSGPIAVRVEGLYLARKDDLTALYCSLVRPTALDLGGCRGTLYGVADNPNREKLVSLVLPPSVTMLEPGGAFRNCTGLVSVDMPGLEYAGDNAFYGCASLAVLKLPALASTGNYAFANCAAFTNLGSEDLPALMSVGDHTFSGCVNLVSLESSSLVSAGQGAFSGCSSLSSLTLPALTSLDQWAFLDCSSLESLSLPALASIGAWAFQRCPIESVNFPALQTIDAQAFENCVGLKELRLPELRSLGDLALANCVNLDAVDFPKLETITGAAFQGCTALTELDFPQLQTIVKVKTFADCASLARVKLPKLALIGGSATNGDTFENCSALAELVLGPSPPSLSGASNIFVGIPAKTITFKVPAASLAAYQAWDAANALTLGAVNRIARVFEAVD